MNKKMNKNRRKQIQRGDKEITKKKKRERSDELSAISRVNLEFMKIFY